MACIVLNHEQPHNHLILPATKASHDIKSLFKQCIDAVGVVGATVKSIENAPSTQRQNSCAVLCSSAGKSPQAGSDMWAKKGCIPTWPRYSWCLGSLHEGSWQASWGSLHTSDHHYPKRQIFDIHSQFLLTQSRSYCNWTSCRHNIQMSSWWSQGGWVCNMGTCSSVCTNLALQQLPLLGCTQIVLISHSIKPYSMLFKVSQNISLGSTSCWSGFLRSWWLFSSNEWAWS